MSFGLLACSLQLENIFLKPLKVAIPPHTCLACECEMGSGQRKDSFLSSPHEFGVRSLGVYVLPTLQRLNSSSLLESPYNIYFYMYDTRDGVFAEVLPSPPSWAPVRPKPQVGTLRSGAILKILLTSWLLCFTFKTWLTRRMRNFFRHSGTGLIPVGSGQLLPHPGSRVWHMQRINRSPSHARRPVQLRYSSGYREFRSPGPECHTCGTDAFSLTRRSASPNRKWIPKLTSASWMFSVGILAIWQCCQPVTPAFLTAALANVAMGSWPWAANVTNVKYVFTKYLEYFRGVWNFWGQRHQIGMRFCRFCWHLMA